MTKLKNIALALLTLVISVSAINAKPVEPVSPIAGEEPFTVKYMGNEGDYVVFQVIVKSDNNKNTSFEISDGSEGEIYSSDINAAFKVQTMKIEKRDNQELNFKLVIGKEVYSKSFVIMSTVMLETK